MQTSNHTLDNYLKKMGAIKGAPISDTVNREVVSPLERVKAYTENQEVIVPLEKAKRGI